MNKCIFLGGITRDPEITVTDKGMKVAKTSIACNRGKDKEGNDKGADFANLVAFDKKADFFEKFVKKGRRFLVETHLQTGSYEKEGKKILTTDFIVDSIEFADSRPVDGEHPKQEAPVDSDGFMNIPDGLEQELPFN